MIDRIEVFPDPDLPISNTYITLLTLSTTQSNLVCYSSYFLLHCDWWMDWNGFFFLATVMGRTSSWKIHGMMGPSLFVDDVPQLAVDSKFEMVMLCLLGRGEIASWRVRSISFVPCHSSKIFDFENFTDSQDWRVTIHGTLQRPRWKQMQAYDLLLTDYRQGIFAS